MVGIFGIATAGLAVDRFVLGPSSASAAMPGTELASAGGPLGELAASATEVLRGSLQQALKDTLQAEIDPGAAQRAGSIDFGPAAAWTANAASLSAPGIDLSVTPAGGGAVAPSGPSPFRGTATPGLTMVMPTSNGGIAVIDGVRLRVGQTHPDGFRLVSLGDRTATIEHNGERFVLSMPVPH